MATRSYSTRILIPHKVMVVTWEGLQNGDDGEPLQAVLYSDRSAQVKGAFGSGGEVTVEGSNDGGTTYTPLTDPQGNSIAITAAKIEAVTELVEYIRPRVTAGDGATNITVVMIVKVP